MTKPGCAYHLAPFGCTLVDGDADGPGLVELYGYKPAGQPDGSPDVRAGSPTQPTSARPSDTPNAAEPSAEIRKRSANLMTWCERCAIGILFRCAADHAIGHSGDDHIGNYCAKDITAKSFLCHDCRSTHKPYVDESDEDDIECDTNPERYPNRLRWRWPGRLKAEGGTRHGRQAGTRRSCRGGRRPSGWRRARRTPAQMRSGSPQATPAAGAAPTLRDDAGLYAHDRANGGLRRPIRPPGASSPAGEPPGSPASP